MTVVVRLKVSRTQWAVGNGFFHSGAIATKTNAVRYVYDCGALRRKANQASLRREVDEYIARTPGVDVVYISHFDFDHVSGIQRLAAGVPVSRYVIPLVPPAERLFVFAGSSGGDPMDGAPADDRFYEDFIVDPAGTLAALGGAEPTPVDVVAPGAAEDSAGGTEAPEGLSPRDLPGADATSRLTVSFNAGRSTASGAATTGAVWEWMPYVAEAARDVTERFVDALVQQDLIDNESDLNDGNLLGRLIESHRKALILAYDIAVESVGKSFTRNVTSLMLYSGPLPHSRFKVYRKRASPVERAEISAWDPRPGWLGLGDADLRAQVRVAEVNSAFHERKPLVGTFAPSHHGSHLDWHASLLTGFDPDPTKLPTFVFGASGTYGHPDGKVLLAINEAGATAVTVGLSASSRWTDTFGVFVQPQAAPAA